MHLSEGQAGEASEIFKQGDVFSGFGEELDRKKLFFVVFFRVLLKDPRQRMDRE